MVLPKAVATVKKKLERVFVRGLLRRSSLKLLKLARIVTWKRSDHLAALKENILR